MLATGVSGIVSNISRTEMDINRQRSNKNAPAIDQYRKAIIREIIRSKELIADDGELKKTIPSNCGF
jgi:hypothetical protein